MKTRTRTERLACNVSQGSLICRTLALCALFLTAAVSSLQAVPATITLDNPNQIIAAPATGMITLDFSGTIVIEPNYQVAQPFVNYAFNSSGLSFLPAHYSPGFVNFFLNIRTGTYTGSIFTVDVGAGTPGDLYLYSGPTGHILTTVGVSVIPIEAFSSGISEGAVATYSVRVIVPEGGSTLLLLGLSAVGLCCIRRALA